MGEIAKKAGQGGERVEQFKNLRPQEESEAEAVFLTRLSKTARKIGWLDSALTRMPLDHNRQPCPWYNYPSLHFLSTRDLSQLHVFEFGSGGSTLWWSRNAASVTSCEHNKGWFERISANKPENVNFVYRELITGGDYCQEILRHSTPFDVIVIDGRDRVNCAKRTLEVIKPQSIIIWDNSNRERYAEGRELLIKTGFRYIDFFGFGPIASHMWGTTFYYRDGNCLGI